MSISHDEIYDACKPILENVGHHKTEARRERRFLTAYQVRFILKNENNPICEVLIEECNGDRVGDGGGEGEHDGPVRRIALALGTREEVDTQYIGTKHLRFDDYECKEIRPSGVDCGIFRLK